ncbi:Formin-like protein 3 [Hordeum vulgare]|nr:Formin-like protein 3 [Hordeum vulgare]
MLFSIFSTIFIKVCFITITTCAATSLGNTSSPSPPHGRSCGLSTEKSLLPAELQQELPSSCQPPALSAEYGDKHVISAQVSPPAAANGGKPTFSASPPPPPPSPPPPPPSSSKHVSSAAAALPPPPPPPQSPPGSNMFPRQRCCHRQLAANLFSHRHRRHHHHHHLILVTYLLHRLHHRHPWQILGQKHLYLH